jgi:hypothetical protein
METTSRVELVDELLVLVRKVYPGWEGFQHPEFLKDERHYKNEAAELAQKLLGREALHDLRTTEAHDEIVERVRRVAQKTNLLYLATPATGDLAPFEGNLLEEPAQLIADLLHGDAPVGDRLDLYRERLERQRWTSPGLTARWPLPTYLLFLLNPQEEIFVKPSVVRWLTARAGDITYQATVSSALYESIRALHREIGEELARRDLPPRDMIDIQSFVWVAYFGEHQVVPPPAATQAAGVPVHHDEPAAVDELGRRPVADVLARRIRQSSEMAAAHEGRFALAVHLHGPWGSGKTSILNFLEEALRKGPHEWVVVRFDAWKHQHIQPPWWSLIREVYAQANRSPQGKRRGRPWRVWWGWKLRASLLPLLLTVATVLSFVAFVYFLSKGERFDLGAAVSLLSGLAALFGALQTKSRSLILGSSKAAEAYLKLSSDPLGPLSKFFERLTRSFGSPVAIFIDDLDRCDADAVVDLLESIQTLFRRAPAVYVVAADREWIRTSFERRYAGFVSSVGEPGRPLGHLFLEKMFQMSLQVPRPTEAIRRKYWRRLINAGQVWSVEDAQERLAQDGEQRLRDAASPREIQRMVDWYKDTPAETGVRIAAARRLSTPQAIAETEHFLEPYALLLEPNPRAMKRLVNAFDGQPQDISGVPPSLQGLFGSASTRRVVAGQPDRPGLDEDSLRQLVGQTSG